MNIMIPPLPLALLQLIGPIVFAHLKRYFNNGLGSKAWTMRRGKKGNFLAYLNELRLQLPSQVEQRTYTIENFRH